MWGYETSYVHCTSELERGSWVMFLWYKVKWTQLCKIWTMSICDVTYDHEIFLYLIVWIYYALIECASWILTLNNMFWTKGPCAFLMVLIAWFPYLVQVMRLPLFLPFFDYFWFRLLKGSLPLFKEDFDHFSKCGYVLKSENDALFLLYLCFFVIV